jgi:ubiquinone/menaquinone biosynthesis C-methylase UbiE
MDEIKIKSVIRKKYAESAITGGCCCSPSTQGEPAGCCGPKLGASSSADEIINAADLGLSCGLPVQDAFIKEGDSVLDLGSGAGVDVFRAAQLVGDSGFVIGVDMTPEMIERAQKNAVDGGYQNTAFKCGEIENLPVPDQSQDVVISNCVINLVPDKKGAFQEIYRVLKSGGHFCISDIVTNGNSTNTPHQKLEDWASCIAGAIEKQRYLEYLEQAGFEDVKIIKSTIYNPLQEENSGLESITVIGYKA